MERMRRKIVMDRDHERAIRDLCVCADSVVWELRTTTLDNATRREIARGLELHWQKVMNEVLP